MTLKFHDKQTASLPSPSIALQSDPCLYKHMFQMPLHAGLFGSVRPVCDSPGALEAPAFTVTASAAGTAAAGDAGPRVRPVLVPPLGAIRFKVVPRVLPAITQMSVRLDSSIKVSHKVHTHTHTPLCMTCVHTSVCTFSWGRLGWVQGTCCHSGSCPHAGSWSWTSTRPSALNTLRSVVPARMLSTCHSMYHPIQPALTACVHTHARHTLSVHVYDTCAPPMPAPLPVHLCHHRPPPRA